jgi:pimeloyl-ACP methyl ester carboxylesterase
MFKFIKINRLGVPLAVVGAVALSGCAFMAPPPSVPMATVRAEPTTPDRGALLVLLPGLRDRADRFVDRGFIEAYSGKRFDIVSADAHFGYYRARTLTERLHEDVIQPARDEGYSEIWLLGISMGGMGSILYANDYPADVDGVILLAPYLGDRCVIEEIDAAGGLAGWSGESSCTEDYEVDMWRWLKETTMASDVDLVLGYGTRDRLAPMYSPLLDVLPESRVYRRDGGHDWPTWTALWSGIGEDI